MTPIIRLAHPDEADTLTGILRRSKASWGYSDEFMRTVHDQLVLTTEQIEDAIAVYVLEAEGRSLGFYHLKIKSRLCWLEDMFIEPEEKGKGFGKLLFNHALQTARTHGYKEIRWDSDPNAEPFYLKMGATRIGLRPSLIKGRALPIMQIALY